MQFSQRNVRDVSDIPSGLKYGWYVCMKYSDSLVSCLVWCPVQNKRIAPVPVHGCRKGGYRINSSHTRDGLQSDNDGLTICYVCSIPRSLVILIKCRCLGEYLSCFCYPFRGKSVSGMYVCMYSNYHMIQLTAHQTIHFEPCSLLFQKY
jgi:hypothetical protein